MSAEDIHAKEKEGALEKLLPDLTVRSHCVDQLGMKSGMHVTCRHDFPSLTVIR